MKKTNVALFHSATRWVRYLPVLLCFIAFSSSDLAAQNFKSTEDASVAVKEALEQVIGDLDQDVDRFDELTGSQSTAIKSYTYYSMYISNLEDSQDVEAALAVLDKQFPATRLDDGNPNGPMNQIREALLELITE